MTDAEIDSLADHISISVYETPGGDICISKNVTIGRHERWQPLARFERGANAKRFANDTARRLGDFFATDDVRVME